MFRKLVYLLITIGVVIVVYSVLRLTIPSVEVAAHQVSMVPTLPPGDRLLISRPSYFSTGPQRGDIIVFYPPQQLRPDLLGEIFPLFSPTVPLIKRVIGLPGDTVEVANGKVIINGSILDEPYIKDPPQYSLRKTAVPTNEYFVLGDNRNNSNDSHIGWTVSRDRIAGKAWLVYWPPKHWGAAPHYSFAALSMQDIYLVCSKDVLSC